MMQLFHNVPFVKFPGIIWSIAKSFNVDHSVSETDVSQFLKFNSFI